MKTKITMIAAFAVLSSGAIAAPAVVGIGGAAEVIAADEKTVTLEVSGLRWASGCSKKVQAALKSVKGVSKATVGKKVGTKADTVVTTAKSVKTTDLIKALKKKGYTATEKTQKKSA